MKTSNIHDNSIQTFYETEQERAKRAADVYEAFVRMGRPVSDREVMDALGYRDMNAVRPRITEMIDAGELIEVGKVRDHVTGRRVRITKIREREAQMAFA